MVVFSCLRHLVSASLAGSNIVTENKRYSIVGFRSFSVKNSTSS